MILTLGGFPVPAAARRLVGLLLAGLLGPAFGAAPEIPAELVELDPTLPRRAMVMAMLAAAEARRQPVRMHRTDPAFLGEEEGEMP